jgi:hypothetical protein
MNEAETEVTIVHNMNVYTVINYPFAHLPKLFTALRKCRGYESYESKLFRNRPMHVLSSKTTIDIGISLPVGAEVLVQFKKLADIN